VVKKRHIVLIFCFSFLVYIYYKSQQKTALLLPSNYQIYSRFFLNRASYYPARSQLTRSDYYPVGAWSGRLVLPSSSLKDKSDFVFIQIDNAPNKYKYLVGQTVRLEWQNTPNIKSYLRQITRNISFAKATRDSQKSGNLHPERLDRKKSVGALRSLAGARPKDDVFVTLPERVTISKIGQNYILKIDSEPVQITGKTYALVTLLRRENKLGRDKFLVRHFESKTQSFSGNIEAVQIPQVPAARDGITRSTNRELEKSWYNASGWYIYGARDKQNTFVVQGIIPRKIVGLTPDVIRFGKDATLAYINNELWHQTSLKKGTAQIVLLEPKANIKSQTKPQWQVGDRALVIHVYGGIGGKKAEPKTFGIVTGHFAYGIATIIREPLSQELTFELNYHQIYAHNSDGIVAGKIEASSYLGDLQRGWLGNRAIADIIIKFDPVTQDYNFDGIKLSPLDELSDELQKMMTRYRIGDGTGAATVTPVTSCVQDANQALYLTIKKVTEKVGKTPKIRAWLDRHPHHPQTDRFNRLIQLGKDLENNLVPLGIVRSDWQQSDRELAGIKQPDNLLDTLFKGAFSWRTILPRRAQDELAAIFLQNGATAWIIRTNQIGGFDPDIAPLAPTVVFGHNSR
jgi:predicted Abi (CAAX) family protease